MTSVSLKKKQETASLLKYVLQRYFQSGFPGMTPNQVHPIALALAYKESALKNIYATDSGSDDSSFIKSSVYNSVLASQDAGKIANMKRAARLVYGVMQVRGSYLILGGSKSGQSEVERIRPDLASTVCVAAGESLEDKIIGEDNMENAMIAGLVILQGKYAAVPSIMTADRSGGYTYSKQNLYFSSRMAAAVGSYLGLNGVDRFGTSAATYASSIMGGDSYRVANSYDPTAKYPDYSVDQDTRGAVQVAQGPTTNGTDAGRTLTPGC